MARLSQLSGFLFMLLFSFSRALELCDECKWGVRLFDDMLCDEGVSEQAVKSVCNLLQTEEVSSFVPRLPLEKKALIQWWVSHATPQGLQNPLLSSSGTFSWVL